MEEGDGSNTPNNIFANHGTRRRIHVNRPLGCFRALGCLVLATQGFTENRKGQLLATNTARGMVTVVAQSFSLWTKQTVVMKSLRRARWFDKTSEME